MLFTQKRLSWLNDISLLAVLFILFYSILLGSHALFTPDEGRYSEVAREMIVTRDYITPRINGVAFLDKPILYYWLQASAIKLFGLKEWSLRFWPALLGVIGTLITYFAGRTLFNRRIGLLSAFILATCPLYYGASHYANLDLEVAIFISLSLFTFLCGIQGALTSSKRILLIMSYVFAALAFLTKGLIGIAFPVMIIGTWVILLNRWTILTKMHLIMGLLIFSAITLPWYILVQKANPQFLHFFFVTQQFSRFLTTQSFNSKATFWFYIPIVFIGAFPWTLFIIGSFTNTIKSIWKNRNTHANELFLLLWVVLIFIFFSIPQSKTIGYILPIFPAMALLIAKRLDTLWDEPFTKRSLTIIVIYALSCFIIGLGSFIAPHIPSLEITPSLAHQLKSNGILFTLSGLLFPFFIRPYSFSKIFYWMLSTSSIFLLILMISTNAINQKSIKPLALELKSILRPGDEIVTYFKYYQDLPIYTEQRITIVADWTASDIPTNDNWLRELWYGMPFQNTQEWLIDETQFWKRFQNDRKRLYVLVNKNYYDQFTRHAKKAIYPVARYNNILLITNTPLI